MLYSQINTVFITGANTGIGNEVAWQIAQMPNTRKVYLGSRNQVRGAEAIWPTCRSKYVRG